MNKHLVIITVLLSLIMCSTAGLYANDTEDAEHNRLPLEYQRHANDTKWNITHYDYSQKSNRNLITIMSHKIDTLLKVKNRSGEYNPLLGHPYIEYYYLTAIQLWADYIKLSLCGAEDIEYFSGDEVTAFNTLFPDLHRFAEDFFQGKYTNGRDPSTSILINDKRRIIHVMRSFENIAVRLDIAHYLQQPYDIPQLVEQSDAAVAYTETPVSELDNTARITKPYIKFYKQPSLKSRSLRLLNKGEQVTVIAETPSTSTPEDYDTTYWYKVRDESGTIGWVCGIHLAFIQNIQPVAEHICTPQERGYYNKNGTIIEKYTEQDITITVRLFNDTYDSEYIRDYLQNCAVPIYDSPRNKRIDTLFAADTNFNVLFLQTFFNRRTDKTESWIKIATSTRKEGWICIGEYNPYHNNYWITERLVHCNGKTIGLTTYNHGFSCDIWKKEVKIYDRPCFENAKAIWTLKLEKNRFDTVLNALFITTNPYTNPATGVKDFWLKVKDNSGREGWIFGSALEINRGGPKYYTPEQYVWSGIHELLTGQELL